MKDNRNNDIISPEIVKLTEKMAKDPASLLFFPLAEEYRKCGMLDEAIVLLTDGLKSHPNFLSARVSLGKIYLQKGFMSEAKLEFEKVVQSAPDNLLAQKKLAMIYKDEGDREKTVESCKQVLLLSPNDEEIKKIKSELETKVEKEPEEKETIAAGIEDKIQADESPAPALEPEEAAEKEAEEEIEFGSSQVYEIKDEDIDLKEILSDESETGTETVSKAEAEDDRSLSGIFNAMPEDGETQEEEPVYEIKDEEVSLDNLLVGREKIEEATILKEETSFKDESLIKEGSLNEEEATAELTPDITVDKEDKAIPDEIASEELAELYIRQEYFDRAIEVLKVLLDKDPSNEILRQKTEDAITLKNLMGSKEDIDFSQSISKTIEDQKPAEETAIETIPLESILEKKDQEEGTEEGADKTKKIRRLEQWLENIKRSHG